MNDLKKAASPDGDWMPVALRDTALTVSDFADKSHEKDIEGLRKDGTAQIAALGSELEARGWPADMIADAQYAQCALLDEAALSSLEEDVRNDWESRPLQLIEFQTNDAGEELLRRIDQRLHESRPVRPLLAIFGAVLDLGFTGRLALEGSDAKARLRQALDARLSSAHRPDEHDTSIVVKGQDVRAWTRQCSPLTCLALVGMMVGLVWFGVNGWLDASVARVTP